MYQLLHTLGRRAFTSANLGQRAITTRTANIVPSVTEDERTVRIMSAGVAWAERIGTQVSNAKLTYVVKAEALGSVASKITANKHVFFVDEPAVLAGDDIAASPVEYALGALISCQIVVYRLYAQNMGIRVSSISVTAEGDLDARGLFGMNETVRPGFSNVRLNVHVTGPESHERYNLLQVAVDKHCPVMDLFANPTPITVKLVVN